MNTEKYIRQDTNKGAVLNTDSYALQLYKERKRTLAAKEAEINNLKEEMRELKTLVQKLLKDKT